jgi:hypothetical protein
VRIEFERAGRQCAVEIEVAVNDDPGQLGCPGYARGTLDGSGQIDALLGFSWGFEKRRGEVALSGPTPLSSADWDRHHAFLRGAFPRWSFAPGFSRRAEVR